MCYNKDNKISMHERMKNMKKHFRLRLPDEGCDIYAPCEGMTWSYRYGPSIMVRDGICEAWFASPGMDRRRLG